MFYIEVSISTLSSKEELSSSSALQCITLCDANKQHKHDGSLRTEFAALQ